MTPVDDRDRGAALVLAIIFIFAIGLVLVAVTNMAGGAATNTFNLRSIRTSELNAENTITSEIAQVRANPNICSSTGTNPSPQLFCTQTTNTFSVQTRVVNFYACPAATAGSPCTATAQGMLVHATVSYDDLPPDNPSATHCSGAATSTCGVSVSITTWDVRSADT